MKFPSAVFVLLASAGVAAAECADVDEALEYWRPIREQAAEREQPANDLALALVPCLGSPNPELRDRIAYELYTYWLRNDRLDDDTRRSLTSTLQQNLESADSLLRSFSALILAEVMRSDGNAPFLSNQDRESLLQTAAAALGREADYRGLEAGIGWVHPVAHMADLLWRFALHPGTDSAEAKLLLSAVRSQVAPTTVSYAFNEGDRLARVVATVIRRDLLPADEIAEWISGFGKPGSMERWGEAFRSPAGMAALHNTKQFLRALSDQLATAELDEAIRAPLDELVAGFTQLI
jgi:hypothetical protein